MDDAWLGQLYERHGFLVRGRCMHLNANQRLDPIPAEGGTATRDET